MDNKHTQYLLLVKLANQLKNATDIAHKCAILDRLPHVNEQLTHFFPNLNFTPSIALVIKSIIAIGQHERVFGKPQTKLTPELEQLLAKLWEIEDFYSEVGGIIGYQMLVYHELITSVFENHLQEEFRHPEGIDLNVHTRQVQKAIIAGLQNLNTMAEIYPIGGAGDRLGLIDVNSGKALPTACLKFQGRTLLEQLIRDVQAKEYLHFQIFHQQVNVPIVLMTSHEKRNRDLIIEILESNNWFNRSKNRFYFCVQPQVPVVTKEGKWAVENPLMPVMKPGGHGVIWKLLKDEGILEQLSSKGFKKALVRQINNPIAGTDHGLLAFCGYGISKDMYFGFASCSRAVKTAEGVLVLREKHDKDYFTYTLSNIEYTDFGKYGIVDAPVSHGSPYSKYPSNTNILFVDIPMVEKKVSINPFPGVILNMKSKWVEKDSSGAEYETTCGRLETTMQNLSDSFTQTFDKKLDDKLFEKFKCYVTYNDRRKTISVAKNKYDENKSAIETPVGCYEDILRNAYQLLQENCHFELPTYPEDGLVPIFFNYHPALGPLYSIIAQKIRGGKMCVNSEMNLEISQIDFQNLFLQGSLVINADQVMGHTDHKNHLLYSNQTGKCTLHNVKICNRGMKPCPRSELWKSSHDHHEMLHIHLIGNGEFHANNVHFNGNHSFTVPDGHKLVVTEDVEGLKFSLNPIDKPTWQWAYQIDENESICLRKEIT
ncbi:MAG: UTP--glucose-1-phosphate uridylyltransferase [Parachlamydiales bacterium]|nr:UTP--glucose-1-phosphate uridylyltransferase [Parachlamydiales bacterium]